MSFIYWVLLGASTIVFYLVGYVTGYNRCDKDRYMDGFKDGIEDRYNKE